MKRILKEKIRQAPANELDQPTKRCSGQSFVDYMALDNGFYEFLLSPVPAACP
jgi:hypothetical protein